MPEGTPEPRLRAVPDDETIVSIVITNHHLDSNVLRDPGPLAAGPLPITITVKVRSKPFGHDLCLDIVSTRPHEVGRDHDLFKPSHTHDAAETVVGEVRSNHRELAEYAPCPLPRPVLGKNMVRSATCGDIDDCAPVDLRHGAARRVRPTKPHQRRLEIGVVASAVALLAGLTILLSTLTPHSANSPAAQSPVVGALKIPADSTASRTAASSAEDRYLEQLYAQHDAAIASALSPMRATPDAHTTTPTTINSYQGLGSVDRGLDMVGRGNATSRWPH